MKPKSSTWLKYVLPAVLGGGVCFFFLRLWDTRTEGVSVFGVWFGLAAAALLVLCITIFQLQSRDTGEKLRQDIRQIDRILSENQENYALMPVSRSLSLELTDLSQHIRTLSNRLRLLNASYQTREKQFRYIFSSLNEGFILLDLNLHILGCNHIAEKVLSLPEDAEHRQLREVVQDPDILEGVDAVLSNAQKVSFDLNLSDGTIYAVQIRMVYPSEEQRRSGILILMLDVTAERSALHQRQDFFSNASHELRTPITSILGFAEMLENGLISDPEQSAQSIHIIRREAIRMSRIINDLLFITKLENEGESIDSPPINVREVAVEIQETLTPSMQEKNIKMEISGGNFSIAMPYSHLYNLLANLMQNAVKYNVENGSVWVRIETDVDKLLIGVRDTGIGIPPEMKSRVFERFFRVDKGRSRNIGGTGLGLSIVKHLVSLYHGTIHLESTLGKGSFFQITLHCPTVSPTPTNLSRGS
ncbi:MAG: sensor histidine kinase [Candidatus Merdivicinus sp.]|jgi:two-component system phosphate regulon sensor histidine kinase PhoR